MKTQPWSHVAPALLGASLLLAPLVGCAVDGEEVPESCAGAKCDDVSGIGVNLDVNDPYEGLRHDDSMHAHIEKIVFKAVALGQLGAPLPENEAKDLEGVPQGNFTIDRHDGHGPMYGVLADDQDYLYLYMAGDFSMFEPGGPAAMEVRPIQVQHPVADVLLQAQVPALRAYVANMQAFRDALYGRLVDFVQAGLAPASQIDVTAVPSDKLYAAGSVGHGAIDPAEPSKAYSLFIAPRPDGGSRWLIKRHDYQTNAVDWFEVQ